MNWVGCARLLDDVVQAIDLVVPWAAMPVVVANEVQNAGALHIESDVAVGCKLIEKVGGIRGLVAASSIVSAAHVRTNSDALRGPAIPHSIRIEASRNHRRCTPPAEAGEQNKNRK